ncbi:MAG: response regulator [Ferruginibacter sp.]
MNSFKRNLVIGYSFSLLLLLGSAVASYISINNLLYHNELVEHTNLVITKLENTISILKDAETGQRGFLLTGDEQFLDPYKGSLTKVYDEIKVLRSLTSDNQLQQLSLIKLTDVVQNRMNILQELIDKKKQNIIISNEDFRTGKIYMDQCRQLVTQMEEREEQLLAERTKKAKRFAETTPLFIVLASLLAVFITVISFIRLVKDYERRKVLQDAIIQKDKDVTERINIISGIAEKVTDGNYQVRIDEGYSDKLGNLATSLNKMTGSLQHAFGLLSKKEWLQTGISGLNNKMLGEQTILSIAEGILNHLTNYTESDIGAFYHYENDVLRFITGYAYQPEEDKKYILPGHGMAGQAVVSRKLISLKNIERSDILINYAAGDIRPRQIIALPVLFEGQVKAVIVLAAIKPFGEAHKEFLQAVSENIGIGVNTAETRKRLNELLNETQAQAEELAAQHSELEGINAELEAQSEKLQVSEEELKVQQEELLQSNSELEERTRLLEERNQLIAEQNRDIELKAEQLELGSKYKSEFLANMSHELRTPLNSILLLSRLMAENNQHNLSDEEVEYARVIQSSGKGLLQLIDEILDLSKIESGKMQMNFSDVPVKALTENLQLLFKQVAIEKNLDFEITVADAVPEIIETDELRLEQVLKNLISNALKFTASGSVKLSISRNGEMISFKVTDTGIGIAKEKQQIVFEAFQQEDGSTRRNYGGTGLGLSISRELSRLLGGDIAIESEPGKGSSFTLSIPLTKPVASAQPPVAEQPLYMPVGTATNQRNYNNISIPPNIPDDRNDTSPVDRVILIIEDDIVFAGMLLEFTRKNGYKGIVAVRGDEGIELAKKYRPEGILLDIYLPVMDGWTVIESLKADKSTNRIPVHVMSSVDLKKRSLQAGAVDFLDKPLSTESMADVFRKIRQLGNDALKKVLIAEENEVHARALAFYLEANDIRAVIVNNMPGAVETLQSPEHDCVIINIGEAGVENYEMLAKIRSTAAVAGTAIIVFTGKTLVPSEEARIKRYADSIVIKTAHSYKRMLDEVSLFLHHMDAGTKPAWTGKLKDVLKDKKVLLVDDDVRNIYSLTKAMEQYGIQVTSATDGKEALKVLEETSGIQLVLMDMMMPEMDGYQTTAAIRNLSRYKNLPIIAVTAKAMAGDREKCIEAGASDYITKPVDTDQLVSLLRVWLYDKH